jgi:hypothetical protein
VEDDIAQEHYYSDHHRRGRGHYRMVGVDHGAGQRQQGGGAVRRRQPRADAHASLVVIGLASDSRHSDRLAAAAADGNPTLAIASQRHASRRLFAVNINV